MLVSMHFIPVNTADIISFLKQVIWRLLYCHQIIPFHKACRIHSFYETVQQSNGFPFHNSLTSVLWDCYSAWRVFCWRDCCQLGIPAHHLISCYSYQLKLSLRDEDTIIRINHYRCCLIQLIPSLLSVSLLRVSLKELQFLFCFFNFVPKLKQSLDTIFVSLCSMVLTLSHGMID